MALWQVGIMGRTAGVLTALQKERAGRPRSQANSLRLNAFDDVGKARAVFVPYRLYGVLERLFIGDVEYLDAGGGGLAHRFLLVGSPQNAFFALCLPRKLADEILVVFRERVPGSSREHDDLRHNQVLGESVVFGDLVMVVEHEARRVVLGAVDNAGLQRAEHLIVAHGDAV